MAAATGFKTENDIKVKPDPDLPSSSSRHLGEEEYEDTGELDIPSRRNGAWLTRIPKILYDKWATLDDDEEIQLGIVRRYRDSGTVCANVMGLMLCDANCTSDEINPRSKWEAQSKGPTGV